MSGKKKLKIYSMLILDESIGIRMHEAFLRYAFEHGLQFNDCIDISRTEPGIPDSLLIAKYLNAQSVLLTTDRPFHNTVLKLGLRSFVIQDDLSINGNLLPSITANKPMLPSKNVDLDSINYQAPPSEIRPLVMPLKEKSLKRLRTRRRRIRNHFGGLHNLTETAMTLSVQANLVGIQMKVSGHDSKALNASERYIRAPKGNPADPFCFALINALQLQLNGVKTVLFYDSPALGNPSQINDPVFKALQREFNALKFVETPKGPFIDALRHKLSTLSRRPNNEIVAGNLDEIRTRVLELLSIQPQDAANANDKPSAFLDPNTDRGSLLLALASFLKKVRRFDDVQQVALIGSLAKEKENPKGLDLMVTVTPDTDLKRLAKLGRHTQGEVQRGNLSSNIFLIEDGKYIGKTCTYREPYQRMECDVKELRCDVERLFLCNTTFLLDQVNISDPPIILHPTFKARVPVPEDVKLVLIDGTM